MQLSKYMNKFKICKKIRSKRKYILPVLIVLILVGYFTYSKLNQSNTPLNTNTKRDEKTSVLTKQTKQITIDTLGIIKGQKEVNLSFKQGGKVSKVNYQEGDFVKKGSLIVYTTSEEQRINLEFQELINDQTYDIKDITKKYYDRLINNAKYELEKSKDYWSSDHPSIKQLENSIKTYKELRNLNTESAKLSGIASDLQKKLANVSVNNTHIYAPFDGYILKQYFEESEFSPTGTPVVHFVSKDLLIKTSLVTQDAKQISNDTRVIANYINPEQIIINDLDQSTINNPEQSVINNPEQSIGTNTEQNTNKISPQSPQKNTNHTNLYVSKIYPSINENNRLVDVEIKLTETPEKLFFNQVVNLQFLVQELDFLSVPKSTLYYDFDGIYITKTDNTKIKVQKILEDEKNIYIPYSGDLEGTKILH